MNDAKLSAAVARVEGWTTMTWTNTDHVRWFPPQSGFLNGQNTPPPYATDWALTGPLVPFLLESGWGIEYWPVKPTPFVIIHHDGERHVSDVTLLRSVCLAVLAAKGER